MKYKYQKGDRVICSERVRLTTHGKLQTLKIPGTIHSRGVGRNEESYYIKYDAEHRYTIKFYDQYMTPDGGWAIPANLEPEPIIPAEK